MKLWVKSNVVDTDFTAKLIDVTPEGKALHLADGIRRVKIDNQNQTVQVDIDLWATSNVFLPGHCICVEISSSNFPRFDINLNTGKTMIESTETKVATQTVCHEQGFSSHIILPIIKA